MHTLDEVLAAVAAEDTRIDSLVTLFESLEKQLADVLSGASLPPSVQAKVDAIFDDATAQAAKIDVALNANVPPPTP